MDSRILKLRIVADSTARIKSRQTTSPSGRRYPPLRDVFQDRASTAVDKTRISNRIGKRLAPLQILMRYTDWIVLLMVSRNHPLLLSVNLLSLQSPTYGVLEYFHLQLAAAIVSIAVPNYGDRGYASFGLLIFELNLVVWVGW